jgi:hypothetical protein
MITLPKLRSKPPVGRRSKRCGFSTVLLALTLSISVGGVLAGVTARLNATDRLERSLTSNQQLDLVYEAAYERLMIRLRFDPNVEFDQWQIHFFDSEGREQNLVASSRVEKVSDDETRILIQLTGMDPATSPIPEKSYRCKIRNSP